MHKAIKASRYVLALIIVAALAVPFAGTACADTVVDGEYSAQVDYGPDPGDVSFGDVWVIQAFDLVNLTDVTIEIRNSTPNSAYTDNMKANAWEVRQFWRASQSVGNRTAHI